MLAAEIEIEAVLRNVVIPVASALCPATMVGNPVLGSVLAFLLPGSVSLPAAPTYPSTLLLPRLRYLAGALRLLLNTPLRWLLCLLRTLL